MEKLLPFFLLTLRFLLTFLLSRRLFERKYSPKQKASRNGALASKVRTSPKSPTYDKKFRHLQDLEENFVQSWQSGQNPILIWHLGQIPILARRKPPFPETAPTIQKKSKLGNLSRNRAYCIGRPCTLGTMNFCRCFSHVEFQTKNRLFLFFLA